MPGSIDLRCESIELLDPAACGLLVLDSLCALALWSNPRLCGVELIKGRAQLGALGARQQQDLGDHLLKYHCRHTFRSSAMPASLSCETRRLATELG